MNTTGLDKPNLLLVDDDETFCSVLKRALEKRNFLVSVANDVKNGIALAEQTEPEFAVIDLTHRTRFRSGTSEKINITR